MPPPFKLTPATASKVCRLVRTTGCTLAEAARAAGVSERTLHRWQALGAEAPRGRFRVFWERLQRARAERTVRDLGTVTKAAELLGDWRAAAWRLERSNPAVYGLQVRVQVDANLRDGLDRLKAALPEEMYFRALGALSNDLVALTETQHLHHHQGPETGRAAPELEDDDDEGLPQ